MTLQQQARAALRLLVEDVSWSLQHFVVNSVAGSFATPRPARMLLYRLMGLNVATAAIFDRCIMVGSGPVSIGKGTFINRECYFEAVGPITIGTDTAVGMQVAFVTSTHPFDEAGRFSADPEGLPVVIGDRCWIGARAMILPGVTIGDDVVVAAGAVVTKDCAASGLYAGVPARRIRELGSGAPATGVATQRDTL